MGPDDHVLDVATGTGAVAAELVLQHRCRVTGVDQSPPMLAAAAARLDDLGLSQRVTLVEAEAEALPFPDASFDGLTVSYLLRYVADPAATLRELVRVVRPGGIVAGLEFGVPPLRPARAAWRLYTGALLPAAGLALGGPALVARRALPAPQHPGLLRAPPAARAARSPPGGRARRGAPAAAEPGRRRGHLGHGGILPELSSWRLLPPFRGMGNGPRGG